MGSLEDFLSAHVPRSEEDVAWNELRFHLTSYLCRSLPPPELVTSARAVVLRAGDVLVVRDPANVHILPGGRREAGERLEQTLEREVLEETGWVLDRPALLGVRHFHHLQPRPAGYRYGYPDFFQVVYVAHARELVPEAREADGYELGAELQPVAEVQRLALPPNERVFLQAALAWSG